MNDIITNGNEIKQRILSEINQSQKSIYLAMAFFTDRDIANAIVAASERNLIIDIILSSNAQNEVVKTIFRDANIKIHAFETGDERGMMHHKFCLIDNRITINGSYNYSYNASNNNVENIHVTDDSSVYNQFYNEFERLKYNIDNNLAVNLLIPANNNMEKNNHKNTIDSFSHQLYTLVYLSAQIDSEEFKKLGYEKSKENHGSVEIFKSEINDLKEQNRLLKLDDSISSNKDKLLSSINNAFENKKADLEIEKQQEIKIITSNNTLENSQLTDKIAKSKDQKQLFETGNEVTSEKGLLQINKEIENNKIEINSLEQSVIVYKFWNLGTILVTLFLVICFFYLSIFFSSAIYKVFFEGNLMEQAKVSGIPMPQPQLIDANAVVNIFRTQGTLFGLLSAIIFLFPLALTNLKIIGSTNQKTNKISFIIGLLVFDVLVSGMVALNTDKINALSSGRQPTLQFWEVVKLGEFYLIFIFGMLPLFITHFLIDFISNAYRKSRKELVDEEKNRKLQILNQIQVELNFEKELVLKKISQVEEAINDLNNKKLLLESEFINNLNQIDIKYSLFQKQVKEVFDEYHAKVSSGKIFNDVILDSRISAFKTGYIDFLPEFYAEQEVSNRVREIENSYKY